MQRKSVIFVADSLDNARIFKTALTGLDVEISSGSSAQLGRLLQQHPDFDLVIFDASYDSGEKISQVENE